MKLVIAGGRELEINYDLIEGLGDIFNLNGLLVKEIVCGGCPTGVDKVAKNYFDCEDSEVRYIEFPADWSKHGKAAGPIRNKQMAEYSDALLLIWDGKSAGSSNMKNEMLKLNKPIFEVIIRTHNAT